MATAREDRMRGDRKQRRNNEYCSIISFVIHTNSQTTCNLHSRQMFQRTFSADGTLRNGKCTDLTMTITLLPTILIFLWNLAVFIRNDLSMHIILFF